MNQTLVKANNLSFKYDDKLTIRDISFNLNSNQITTICGINGCGKTTLIKLILKILKPNTGKIEHFIDIPKQCSYIPQNLSYNQKLPIKVLDVVKTARLFGNKLFYNKNDYELAIKALEQVEMIDNSLEDFRKLSLGQKQRVLIANAIARNAKLIIMDEPFASVDYQTTNKILNNLNLIKQNSTIVMVSHYELNNSIVDKIITLKN